MNNTSLNFAERLRKSQEASETEHMEERKSYLRTRNFPKISASRFG